MAQKKAPVANGNRWANVGIGIVMLLLLGLIYAWSVFVDPLEKEFGWLRSQTSMTFSISMSFFCIGGILGGFLTKRLASQRIIQIGALLLLVGFILASRAQSLLSFYFSYGFVCSLGVGLIYNALIGSITRAFPDKQGLISGLLLMGFGFGGFLFSSLASALMNAFGWRTTFVVFGLVFAAILIAGSFFLRPATAPSMAQAKKSPSSASLTPLQMLKKPAFWTYYLWSMLMSAAGLALIGHARQIVQMLSASSASLGYLAGWAVFLVGLLSVCNGVGRVLFGLSFDRLGWSKSMGIISAGFTVSAILLLLSFQIHSGLLLVVGIVLTGLCYGGVPTANSSITSQFYGPASFPLNYSITNTVLIPAAFLGPYVSATLFQRDGSYISTFIVTSLMGVIAFVCWLIMMKLRSSNSQTHT